VTTARSPWQLVPFNDTPNNGGEYKVWVTLRANYVCSTTSAIVDCGPKKQGQPTGSSEVQQDGQFQGPGCRPEIDTRFWDKPR